MTVIAHPPTHSVEYLSPRGRLIEVKLPARDRDDAIAKVLGPRGHRMRALFVGCKNLMPAPSGGFKRG